RGETVLLIFRKGKWDLPKGKLDPGETLEACAVREVQEETGLQEINLGAYLHTTFHTYTEGNELALKESVWYLMEHTGPGEGLTPQREEDIEECIWVPLTGLEPYLGNTHASIADVVRVALKVLKAKK
ncbi:MAG TPA: NUDIX domain-containing protein, partial [Chitinophagaceae bacterium]|nr:NUDIX domain-containing protein [Chitinophagaceae bacterium]